MSCPKCTGPSQDGLCQSCRLEEEHEFFERRAEEMGAGIVRTGPDADDTTIVGGDD